jgi:NADH-quinone oxidoreductase subunit A
MTPLIAVAILFLAVGIGFIFVHLLIGKLIRPNNPGAEKKTIYECGEPTIGSAWIQFDLRFYVVALLFVVFDVEVAFFFPWAEVFGKANNIAAHGKPTTPAEWRNYALQMADLTPPTNPERRNTYRQIAQMTDGQFADPATTATLDKLLTQDFDANRQTAHRLAWLAFVEVAVFFGVLLVGFAYLWRRGDLAWVRSTLAERPAEAPAAPTRPAGPPLVGAGSGS